MRLPTGYKPEEFIPFLEQLVTERNETYRQASLRSGLDHGAVRRYLKAGSRPSRDACISLAYHFGVHPNVMLQKAGYPPLAYFDLSLADPAEFAPAVKEVARELMKIEDTALRERVCEAVLRLVREMFTASAEGGRQA